MAFYVDTQQLISSTAGTSAHSNPAAGDIWYDTSSDELKTYDGAAWNAAGGGGGGISYTGDGTTLSGTNVTFTPGTWAFYASRTDRHLALNIPMANVAGGWVIGHTGGDASTQGRQNYAILNGATGTASASALEPAYLFGHITVTGNTTTAWNTPNGFYGTTTITARLIG